MPTKDEWIIIIFLLIVIAFLLALNGIAIIPGE